MKLLIRRQTYRGESGVESTFLKEETLLQSGFVRLVDALFAHGHNQLGVRSNLLAHLDCLAYQLLGCNNAADKT